MPLGRSRSCLLERRPFRLHSSGDRWNEMNGVKRLTFHVLRSTNASFNQLRTIFGRFYYTLSKEVIQ